MSKGWEIGIATTTTTTTTVTTPRVATAKAAAKMCAITRLKAEKKTGAEEATEVPRQPFQSCPPHTYMLLLFSSSILVAHVYSLWVKLALFYAVTWTLSPFGDWREVQLSLKSALTQPHKDVPLLHNTVGFFYLFWKLFYCIPVETILWYLDDILFPEYQQTEIKEPLFLLGQPRSGTTMFETLLSEDDERHCSLMLYEMRYPYLTVQYAVDWVSYLDKKLLGGRGYQFVLAIGLLSILDETGERKEMRRLRYDLPDEDDLVFFCHTFCHFMFSGFYPTKEMVRFNHRFSDLPKETRLRYMDFHRKAIQKVLYRRGHGRRYLAKWVAGWNGQLDEAKALYPDAKYVVIVRDPKESLRSWMKLQGLLSYQLTGNNIMRNHPDVRETIIQENIRWYHNEVEFCQTTSRKNLLVLRYTDIVQDIPEQVKFLYDFLGQHIERGSKFHKILLNSKRKQTRHKKTRIHAEDELISEKRIDDDFPRLLQEIRFSRPATKAQS